jgi:uncharacterized protein
MKLSSVIPDAVLATATIGLWAQAPQQGRSQAQGRGGGGAGFWAGKKKLLIVADVSTGFHHDSISHAIAPVERLGRESGAYMSMIRTDPQLITKDQIMGQGPRYAGRGVNASTLDFYDVVFLLPAGIGTFTDKQKADLLSFVHDDGNGIVVGHAATVG